MQQENTPKPKQNKIQGQIQNVAKRTSSQKQKTALYKNVKLERTRPQLTKNAQVIEKSVAFENRQYELRIPKRDPKSQLKIIPLGGLDGIGKNMCAFECDDQIIIDDAGLMFPDDDHPGIDLILPDYTYLLENASKIRGIVITHGHEDHTGCLPYLLKDLDQEVIIYSSKLTLGLIQIKLSEFNITKVKLVEVHPGQQIQAGPFYVNFFVVNHSIPGAMGLFIQTPAGNILHTGDFKIDQSPIDNVSMDFEAIRKFSQLGIDLLMSDSTNAPHKGCTLSESFVGGALSEIIAQAKGKVIIASFASHIHRMQQICDAAVSNGRKVIVTGRSMIQNTDIARKLGYLHIADDDIIDAYYLDRIPPEKIVVMCTGSQGEPLSALARISTGGHRSITIEEGDTVIISATPVPGNEKAVTRIVNSLNKIGADVYDKSRSLVHVSGHASQEELKLLLSVAKPRQFMPVHGEAQHLAAHAQLAIQCGVEPENIFILDNGDTIVMQNGELEIGEPVESGLIYVDGLSVGDTSQDILDERLALSTQGVAVIAAAVSQSKHSVMGTIALQMHGVTGGNDDEIQQEAERIVAGSITRALARGNDVSSCKKIARDSLLSYLWENIKQRPLVITNLIEV